MSEIKLKNKKTGEIITLRKKSSVAKERKEDTPPGLITGDITNLRRPQFGLAPMLGGVAAQPVVREGVMPAMRGSLSGIGVPVNQIPEPETNIGKAVEVGTMIPSLIAGPLGAAGRGARAMAPKGLRSVAEGAAVGALLSPEEDFLNFKERGYQAVAGGLTSGAMKSATRLAGASTKALKNAAVRTINSLIKKTKQSVAYGQEPAEAILRENIVANSFDDLMQKVSQKRQQIGSELGALLSNKEYKNKALNLKKINSVFDDAINKLKESKRSNKSIIKRIKDYKKDILENKNLEKINLSDSLKLKQQIKDLTKYTGNIGDDTTANKVLQKAYRSVQDEIIKVVPKSRQLNKRYADIITAEKLINNRSNIVDRKGFMDFFGNIVGGSGIGYGIMQGDPSLVAKGVGAGIAASAARNVLTSPGAATRFAKLTNDLSKLNLPEGVKKNLIERTPSVLAIEQFKKRKKGD